MARHIPIRQCVGCGAKRPKRELIRIVRTPQGVVELDTTGRTAGRGAYICPSGECLQAAIRSRRLQKALEQEITQELVVRLAERLGTMAEE